MPDIFAPQDIPYNPGGYSGDNEVGPQFEGMGGLYHFDQAVEGIPGGWDLSQLPFYTPPSGTGDNYQEGRIDHPSLKQWLDQNNYRMMEQSTGRNQGYKWLQDSSGKLFGDKQYFNTNDPVEALAVGLTGAALSPFGGLMIGGGGLGGALGLSGAYATAANAGLSGMFNSMAQGARGTDILKSGVINAGGAGLMPDVAGMAGITNPDLAGGINSALRGAATTALGGGDWKQGAVQGAIDSGLSSLGNMFNTTPSQYSLGSARLGESTSDTNPYSLGSARFGDRAPMETNMYSPAYTPTPSTGANNVFSPNNESSNLMDNPFMQSVQEYLGNVSPKQIGSMAEGLMGLYEGYNQRRSAKETMRGLDARRGAYETQLRKNLARRDAASGRRSNYGGREVELQSALAQLDSRNAPMLAQLQQARQGGLSNMFRTALRTGSKMGWFGQPQQQQAQPFLPSLMNFNQDFTPNYSFSTPNFNPQPSMGMYDLGRARLGGS